MKKNVLLKLIVLLITVSMLLSACGTKTDEAVDDTIVKNVEDEAEESDDGSAEFEVNENDDNTEINASEDDSNEFLQADDSLESDADVQEDFCSISIDSLKGVWQLVAETPAGDPYIYQLEIKEYQMVSFEGYSMAGDGWFQNYCYDGSLDEITDDTIVLEEDEILLQVEVSELDENGTETDRLSCVYSVCYTDESENTITFFHKAGDYLISVTDRMPIIFDKVDQALEPGDSVLGNDEF